jgi:hypothetical protein
MEEQEKDLEILILRQQLAILQRKQVSYLIKFGTTEAEKACF